MSVVYCEDCDTHVDTDFNAEHFCLECEREAVCEHGYCTEHFGEECKGDDCNE